MTRFPLPLLFLLAMLLPAAVQQARAAEARHPAVLFTGGVHAAYFARPLHQQGIELDTCSPDALPKLLPTGKYNVVVVTGGLTSPAVVEALQAFMAGGGGVVVFPGAKWEQDAYLAQEHFLERFGAHFTMVLVQESDKTKTVPSFASSLSATDNILPPFNAGVPGLLYLNAGSQEGLCAPVSVTGDGNWKPVVKASPTAQAVPYTQEKKTFVLPYVPKAAETAPMLVAAREVGAGRLAAVSITPEWSFQSPTNCPPVEQMMTTGQGGKPSNWVGLYANLFRWLAEPSLAAGKGGAITPDKVLNSSVDKWADAPVRDWTKAPPIGDMEQLPGLIGARSNYSGGKATVAEWVKAAKAAGLKYLVFLEPIDSLTADSFAKFKADCEKNTDATFFACPGLWGKDVYGHNSMFTYGENVQWPLPGILTKDGKYFDNSIGLPKQTRTKYIFDYFFEQLNYHGQFGYFRHNENTVPPWEYKMNNTFVVYSTENGKPLDSALADFQYLQATNFCYHPTAFSLMDDPAQLAQAVQHDWLVVNVAPGEFGDGSYSEEFGEGIPAMRKLFKSQVAWLRPFQYITQGPKIDCWRGRWEVTIPSGEWFRPDLWRYRARLHVTSPVGLKEITLYSWGKVLYRFQPNGAKDFDYTFEMENSQQRAVYPIIEDINGKKAIGSYVRNTNTLFNEFICGDRCNFLCYGMTRTKDGRWTRFHPGGNGVTMNKGCWSGEISPATSLTVDFPTLPTDGAPQGKETPRFFFAPQIATPGYPNTSQLECKPKSVLASPDVIIGGGSLNAVLTDDSAWGNAWSWWAPTKPFEQLEGTGMNTIFSWMPEGLRCGWFDFRLTTKKELPLTDTKLPVVFVNTSFSELRDGDGHVYQANDPKTPEMGTFKAGSYILADADGGPAALFSMDDNLTYRRHGNDIQLGLRWPAAAIAANSPLNTRIGYLGAPAGTDLSALRNYFTIMAAVPAGITARKGTALKTDGLVLRIDGKQQGTDIRFPVSTLKAFWPVVLEQMNPNWDVWLLDRTRQSPNWRQLPMVDGVAYATVPSDIPQNLFLGHPVLADNPAVKITLCNLLPGQWQVSLHNPTDKTLTARVWTAASWTPFKLRTKSYTLAAGSSVDIPVGTK